MKAYKYVFTVFLIALYYYLFARRYVKKYRQGGVINTNHEEKPMNITPPGIVFLTEVPKLGTGWKTTPEFSEPPLNNLNSSNDIRKYFDRITFSYDELFIGNGLDKVNYTTNFIENYGKTFILRPELGSITTNRDTTLEIKLNASLNFFMGLVDDQFAFITANPSVPIKVEKIDSNTGRHYIHLKAIKHLKLNSKGSPCEASDDYRFAICLENRIVSQVGCQPFWIQRKIEPFLPLCHSARKIDEVLQKFEFLQELALDELITNYECLMPCAYTKYEVTSSLLMESSGHTEVSLVFQSPTVAIVKEEDAYSLESFVADIGGVLGLFVGFNFLQIWDLLDLLKTKWNPLKIMF